MKNYLGLMLIGLLLAAMAGIFWHIQLKYYLPTPVPEDYRPLAISSSLELEQFLPQGGSGRPLLLHFYNPFCPCSRYNFSHFTELAQRYGGQVDSYLVLQASQYQGPAEAVADFRRQYPGLNVPLLVDLRHHLADYCGVYATPQAVLVDAEGCLYYRGNYNQARYCNLPDRQFVAQALVALLAREPPPNFGPVATRAYGCELPGKTDQTSLFPFL